MENYQVASLNGESFALQADGQGVRIIDVIAAKNLTAKDSGATLILKAAAGAAIALPALKAGLKYKFTVGLAFATTNWTIVSATSVIQGNVLVNSLHVPAVNENTVSFVATADSLGDSIELECDGTNWYLNGSGVTTGSITVTAP